MVSQLAVDHVGVPAAQADAHHRDVGAEVVVQRESGQKTEDEVDRADAVDNLGAEREAV